MADPTNGSSNNATNELQQIYQIISDRSEGKATNDDVETAVSRLLAKEKSTIAGAAVNSSAVNHAAAAAAAASTTDGVAGRKPPPPPPPPGSVARKPPPAVRLAAAAAKAKEDDELFIDEDMEDYDNLDDDAEKPSSPQPLATKKPPALKRGRPRKKHDKLPEPDWSLYSEIPLGKEGAKMMTTFGDCRLGSDPAAVAATLLGARRMLQAVIQDARHLRRKYRQLYKHAKKSVRGEKAQEQAALQQQQGEWTAELLYKALHGRDSQSSAPPCGFGIEELQQLCPEEMNVYQRWNEMHEAAAVDEDEKQQAEKVAAAVKTPDKNGGDDNDSDDSDKKDRIDMALAEGHLQERAEQFDLRTVRMEKSWYLQFSNIRKGSFLTRRGRGPAAASSPAAAGSGSTYDENPEDKRVGRPAVGGWATMPKTHVRFLHWVGFDPQSALPPPNKDTTHVLAFLAHDFFGRIVEKAILLRNQQKQKQTDVLNELQAGEHLSEADIDRAMQDPDIKPQPIYGSSSASASSNGNAAVGTQLYFGPGFEERLELEMEEIVQAWTKKKKKDLLSEEELQILQEEEALFQKLSAPPTLEGAKLLAADPSTSNTAASEEGMDDGAGARVDTNKSDKKIPPVEPKKRRGRPPKKKKANTADSTNQQSPGTQENKRRGRSPSAKKESSEAAIVDKVESDSKKPAAAPSLPPTEPKKRRGRPTTAKKESVDLVANDKDKSAKKQPPPRTKSQTADKKKKSAPAGIDDGPKAPSDKTPSTSATPKKGRAQSNKDETKLVEAEPTKKRKAEETPSRRSARVRSTK